MASGILLPLNTSPSQAFLPSCPGITTVPQPSSPVPLYPAAPPQPGLTPPPYPDLRCFAVPSPHSPCSPALFPTHALPLAHHVVQLLRWSFPRGQDTPCSPMFFFSSGNVCIGPQCCSAAPSGGGVCACSAPSGCTGRQREGIANTLGLAAVEEGPPPAAQPDWHH